MQPDQNNGGQLLNSQPNNQDGSTMPPQVSTTPDVSSKSFADVAPPSGDPSTVVSSSSANSSSGSSSGRPNIPKPKFSSRLPRSASFRQPQQNTNSVPSDNPSATTSNGLPPSNRGKGKRIALILTSLVAVVGIAVGAYFLLGNKDSVDNNQVSNNLKQDSPTSSDKSIPKPLQAIDKKFKDFRITKDRFYDNDSLLSDMLLVNFDGSPAYFTDKAEVWQYYQLDTESSLGIDRTKADPCRPVYTKYGPDLEEIIKAFKDDGYVSILPQYADRPHFYAQYEDCNQGAMFTSSEFICSVIFVSGYDRTSKLGPDNPGHYTLEAGCSKRSSLTDKIAIANEYQQILQDTTGRKANSMANIPEYVKDSQDGDYRIAITTDQTVSSSYYQKKDQKWQKVPTDMNSVLTCSLVEANPEVKKAFKGETCTVSEDSSSSSGVVTKTIE